jgi:uncharacterized cupredoxin-like copper-binding protein
MLVGGSAALKNQENPMSSVVRRGVMTVAVAATLLIGGTSAVAIAATAHAASTTVKVTAVEFHFTLSKSSAAPGTVVFDVTNKGKLAHDFQINGKVTSLLEPGQSGKLTVTFKKAGSYTYTRTIPGHAAAGMKGKFKIT